ncbi:hypothetical protein DRP04_00215 [Archaeoglobales archaeon]|jgi:hypothetical protein|nr:MAG: hypothetical protein DRP04_00215 [Archaeoglobales archaeon]
MDFSVEKTAVYKFFNVCREDVDSITEVVAALEGFVPDVYWHEDVAIAIVSGSGTNHIDYEEATAYKILTLQDALNSIGDRKACKIDLVYRDPGFEVYVCWTHRKVWKIDTTGIGSLLDNPPKTCKECEDAIRRAHQVAEGTS